MYTYLQKYHVVVSSNTNINEMPQAHLLLTCTNNYLCIVHSHSLASFVLFELKPPAENQDNLTSIMMLLIQTYGPCSFLVSYVFSQHCLRILQKIAKQRMNRGRGGA